MYAGDCACVNTIEQALEICALVDPGASGFLGLAIDVYHTWWDPRLSAMIARTAAENRLNVPRQPDEAGQQAINRAFYRCSWP